MSKIQTQFLRVGYIDELALGDSPLHRVGAPAKLFTTLFFIVTVVSFNRYTLTAMFPFFIFPAVMISLGGLPIGFIAKSVLIASPFAFMVGVFNPLLDQQVMVDFFGIQVSGGWISFLSILMRFTLTVSAALVLIGLTGFNRVCEALEKFHLPKGFVVQLMFLYRYLFVLAEEAGRMVTARTLRSFGKGDGLSAYVPLLGHLLLRSMDRAQRIHLAMFSRGFDGSFKLVNKHKTSIVDIVFVLGWCTAFLFFRIYNIPLIMGSAITGIF